MWNRLLVPLLSDDQHRTTSWHCDPKNLPHWTVSFGRKFFLYKTKKPGWYIQSGLRSKAVTGSEDPVQPEGLCGRGLCLGRAAVKRIILADPDD